MAAGESGGEAAKGVAGLRASRKQAMEEQGAREEAQHSTAQQPADHAATGGRIMAMTTWGDGDGDDLVIMMMIW